MAITEEIVEAFFIGSIVTLGIITVLLLLAALYVYTSYSWYTILRKLKYENAWLAWIPLVNVIPILEVGGFHWGWFFLIFIPILGWIALAVMAIISVWRIFEMRKYPGWFSLAAIIPQIGSIISLIVLGFVAFKDRKKMLFA